MAIATNTDAGADEWRIDDEVIQLRRWGTAEVVALPERGGEHTIGAAEGVWLRLEDETNRVARLHARLVFDGARWVIEDRESKNGIQCAGARRLSFPLSPGVEIGIGEITLIAESARLVALRGVLARLIGWSDALAPEIDLALRAVRMAAASRCSCAAPAISCRSHTSSIAMRSAMPARSSSAIRAAVPSTRARVPRGSITRAAAQLAMSHAALSEWVARRTLPA